MTPNDRFIENPLLFLRQNIIRVTSAEEHVSKHGGVGRFSLRDGSKDDVKGYNFHGKQIGFYFLGEGIRDHLIYAYWCPYREDHAGFTTVWNEANFMFTATMDGCTFAIGNETEQGARLVGHINSASTGDRFGEEAQASTNRVRFGFIADRV